ncbi:MAG: hypothetical protein DRG09_00055 [Epsilonproteobacteria bacterium]|nr:MAG: hypothetical protein DRG09_00055 [Campylobacterota bacterium]
MNKQKFITLTLIISGLVLNPVIAETVHHTVIQSQHINQSVVSNISTILHNRGLDEDVAEEMASNLVSEEDEMLLAMMMETLQMQNIVTKNEVLEYLSHAALHKQTLDFKSYDHLVGMVSKIKQTSLDPYTLKELSHLTKINKQLFV